jgi:hypothetical protein
MKTMNDKEKFIQAYIVTFLASYAAVTYQHNCSTGWVGSIQPVDDARCLAEEAWEASLLPAVSTKRFSNWPTRWARRD